MFALARAMLIAALLLQSLMGLSIASCEPSLPAGPMCVLPRVPASTPAKAICPCCADKPMQACCCGDSKPEPTQTPSPEPTSSRAQQFLAIVPALTGLLPSLSQPAQRSWPSADARPCAPTNSIQSLLCVWVV